MGGKHKHVHENLIKWLNDEHMDKVWPTLTSLVYTSLVSLYWSR